MPGHFSVANKHRTRHGLEYTVTHVWLSSFYAFGSKAQTALQGSGWMARVSHLISEDDGPVRNIIECRRAKVVIDGNVP